MQRISKMFIGSFISLSVANHWILRIIKILEACFPIMGYISQWFSSEKYDKEEFKTFEEGALNQNRGEDFSVWRIMDKIIIGNYVF